MLFGQIMNISNSFVYNNLVTDLKSARMRNTMCWVPIFTLNVNILKKPLLHNNNNNTFAIIKYANKSDVAAKTSNRKTTKNHCRHLIPLL